MQVKSNFIVERLVIEAVLTAASSKKPNKEGRKAAAKPSAAYPNQTFAKSFNETKLNFFRRSTWKAKEGKVGETKG